ncbi:MAG: hypothetical protein ACYCOU_25475 [Sulfobacillus sp.]
MADNTEGASTVLGEVVGQIVPAVRLKTDAKIEEAKRMPLFYIDDVEYTVPAKPAPNIGLRYLYLLQTEGEAAANFFLLNSLLGDEGYKALMEYDKLTQEDFDSVMSRAVFISIGPKEPNRNSRQNGSPGRNGASGRSKSSGSRGISRT